MSRLRRLFPDFFHNSFSRSFDHFTVSFICVVVMMLMNVADVIIAMSATAYAQTRAGGTFITSGIIGPRGDEVKQALLAAGFDITAVTEENDWLCITAKKS